jgi:hypothetical protein
MQRLMASGHSINHASENLKGFVTVCTLQQTTTFYSFLCFLGLWFSVFRQLFDAIAGVQKRVPCFLVLMVIYV